MFPVSSCDGSRGSLGLGLVTLRIAGERPGLPVCGVDGVRRPGLTVPSGERSSCRAWYGLLAAAGSIRGSGTLAGLVGGLFRPCFTGGNRLRCFSVEGDVTGDVGFWTGSSSFCCVGHTCSPIAEIWISDPQSEHLIDGRMLSGRSVSMAASGCRVYSSSFGLWFQVARGS